MKTKIFKHREIVPREIPKNLSKAFELLTTLPDDFFSEGRNDSQPQGKENENRLSPSPS